jgi:hypothetical protein
MSNPTGSQIATDQTPKKPGKVWGRPFAKGVSGNPGGRKKVPENVGDIAREATPDAIRTLIKIMKSEKASFAVRAYCADKIIAPTANRHSKTTSPSEPHNAQSAISQMTNCWRLSNGNAPRPRWRRPWSSSSRRSRSSPSWASSPRSSLSPVKQQPVPSRSGSCGGLPRISTRSLRH